MPRMPIPITIRGKRYPSKKAAANALNVSPNAIRIAEVQNRLDRVGLPNAPRNKAIVLDGIEYPTIAECSRKTGIPYSTLREMFRSPRNHKKADHET